MLRASAEGNSCGVMSGECSENFTVDWKPIALPWLFVNCIYDKELHRCRYYNNLSINTHLCATAVCGLKNAQKDGEEPKSAAVFIWNLKGKNRKIFRGAEQKFRGAKAPLKMA